MNDAKLNQLIDIYDISYKPWWHSTRLYVSAIALGIVIFSVVVWAIWKWLKRKKQLSFEQIALLQLQQLYDKPYESDAALQEAYFHITMIMKSYLAKHYNIILLNKTDPEIIEALKMVVPADIFATLQELFERAYQIKFAQAAISQKMLYDDINYMQRIIYQTIKQENRAGNS